MQTILDGEQALAGLSAELARRRIARPLLVMGVDVGSIEKIRELLNAALSDVEPVRFSDFSPNPGWTDALAGTQTLSRQGCDGVLAVGGGSAIDVAKTIRAFYAYPGEERDVATGTTKVALPLLPMIAIPTTAGTGSEATHFAVTYVDGKKYSIAADSLLPEVAVLDVRLLESLPPRIAASTGFDALCQGIESYWAKGATELSRGYAAAAIPVLVRSLPAMVNNPDRQVREAMMRAAHQSGQAINVSKTTAPHALSYTITSDFGIPHGHAVALSLGRFFRINEELASAQDLVGIRECLADIYQLIGVESAAQAERCWYSLMDTCGLERDLSCFGHVSDDQYEHIVGSVNLQRLENHPLNLEASHLRRALG